MSFSKVFKQAADDAKLSVSRMIKSDSLFSCQLININNFNGEELQYPDHTEVTEWMKKLLSETFVPKPLNEKAVANMKAKGILPGKNPRDLFLVIVCGSETHVHMSVSIPRTLEQHDVMDFVKCVMGDREFVFETIHDSVGKFIVVNYQCESPLKERDVILQSAFNELKKRHVYFDDGDDDQIYEV